MEKKRLDALKAAKQEAHKQVAGKEWRNLSAKEKDTLLHTLCRMFGLVEDE